jgi:hypothetical protein
MTLEESPTNLYGDGKDSEALESAKQWLDTKYDLAVRLFIVQYNLARYLETGEQRYADEIDQYYRGVDSLDKDLSRDFSVIYDELMQLARYYDAAILFHVKKRPELALGLLNAYCPMKGHERKMGCHERNYWYFESQARDGHDRFKEEADFIADLTVGMAYNDYKMIGHALEIQAGYDIQHATERAALYAERNDNNDEVMRRFCLVPAQYFKYGPDTENYDAYVAAFERANCKAYLPPEATQKSKPAPYVPTPAQTEATCLFQPDREECNTKLKPRSVTK